MNPLGIGDASNFLVAESSAPERAVLGFGQLRQLQPGALELASLVVLPQSRHEPKFKTNALATASREPQVAGSSSASQHRQPPPTALRRGQGLGGELIRELVQRAGGQAVYLVTTGQRVPLYERHGFRELRAEQAPGCARVASASAARSPLRRRGVRAPAAQGPSCCTLLLLHHPALRVLHRALRMELALGTVVARIVAGDRLAVMQHAPEG